MTHLEHDFIDFSTSSCKFCYKKIDKQNYSKHIEACKPLQEYW